MIILETFLSTVPGGFKMQRQAHVHDLEVKIMYTAARSPGYFTTAAGCPCCCAASGHKLS